MDSVRALLLPCPIVATMRSCLARKNHEHSQKSWRDSATERCPMKLVKEVLEACMEQLVLRGVVCALEVGEAVVEEVDSNQGGQLKEVLDRITR